MNESIIGSLNRYDTNINEVKGLGKHFKTNLEMLEKNGSYESCNAYIDLLYDADKAARLASRSINYNYFKYYLNVLYDTQTDRWL